MPVFDACLDADIYLLHVRQEARCCPHGRRLGQAHRPTRRLLGHGRSWVRQHPHRTLRRNDLRVAPRAAERMRSNGPARQGRVFKRWPQAEIASHVSKASWTAEKRLQPAPMTYEKALDIATSGRPGPVPHRPCPSIPSTARWNRRKTRSYRTARSLSPGRVIADDGRRASALRTA